MSILHVAGARPNFPKLAPVWSALDELGARQDLVHTGQHYDDLLSDSFFRDLGLPAPVANLNVGSGMHAAQTAAIMIGLEKLLMEMRPRLVLVYGDVNSTLAAALVCAKLHIPTAHVEAGLRSFDRRMPEEINRYVTDGLASLHFVTSPEGIANLAREGAAPSSIHLVGNPMIDSLLKAMPNLDYSHVPDVPASSGFAVATLHRPANVDTAMGAARSVAMLAAIAERFPTVVALHPRGRKNLLHAGLGGVRNLQIVDPVPYLSFLGMVSRSSLVVTDSGGLQEETTILGIPCITLRTTTERPITISKGTNVLADPSAVPALADRARNDDWVLPTEAPPLWDGHAGERIARICMEFLRTTGD